MENKLPNRKHLRLTGFDYSTPGYYFVTICTMTKIEWFGEISGASVILNAKGKIVEDCWFDLQNHYPNCELDYYVIMPDHFHGIIIITEQDIVSRDGSETHPNKNRIHGLSEIIRSFKSYSSRRINELPESKSKFHWQTSFYDRIIRNEKELLRIRKYIQDNPLKKELERLPENLVL
ncbi:MAG: transposase [Ignavibacteriales bacterium]|nr:transposase [Ignavibacteriales bacterium]